MDYENFAKKFDHTYLSPTATQEDINRVCCEACQWGVASVCVASRWVEYAASFIASNFKGSIPISATVGFPHGNAVYGAKVQEMSLVLLQGAKEIDVVADLGNIADRRFLRLEDEVRGLAKRAHDHGAKLKVIIETGYFNKGTIRDAVLAVVNGGADFVKTSTGFGPRGVSLEDVEIMKGVVPPGVVSIKAAGGVRDLDFALKLIQAGAERIGCSSTVKILKDFKEQCERGA